MRRNLWYDDCAVIRAWDETVLAIEERQQQQIGEGGGAPPPLPSSSALGGGGGGGGGGCFDHDAVDTARQALVNGLYPLYEKIMRLSPPPWSNGSLAATEFKRASGEFLELCQDVDRLLSTSPSHLLGRWLAAAKAGATTAAEGALYEFNARNQGRRSRRSETKRKRDR